METKAKRKRGLFNIEKGLQLDDTAVKELQRESDQNLALHVVNIIYSQHEKIGHSIDCSETKRWYTLEFDSIDSVQLAPIVEIVGTYSQSIRDVIVSFGDDIGGHPSKKKFKIKFEIFYTQSQTTEPTYPQQRKYDKVQTEITRATFEQLLVPGTWSATDERSLRVANLVNNIVCNIEEFAPKVDLILGRSEDEISGETIFELKFLNLDFVKYSFLEYLFDMMTPTRLKIYFGIKEASGSRDENTWFMSVQYMEQSLTRDRRRSGFYSSLVKRGLCGQKKQYDGTLAIDDEVERKRRNDSTNFQVNVYSNKQE